jgi:hypothetical protein
MTGFSDCRDIKPAHTFFGNPNGIKNMIIDMNTKTTHFIQGIFGTDKIGMVFHEPLRTQSTPRFLVGHRRKNQIAFEGDFFTMRFEKNR